MRFFVFTTAAFLLLTPSACCAKTGANTTVHQKTTSSIDAQARYLDALNRRILKIWNPPPNSGRLSTTVEAKILRNGSIVNAIVTEHAVTDENSDVGANPKAMDRSALTILKLLRKHPIPNTVPAPLAISITFSVDINNRLGHVPIVSVQPL